MATYPDRPTPGSGHTGEALLDTDQTAPSCSMALGSLEVLGEEHEKVEFDRGPVGI
jgi:hypothetical protein